MFDKLDLTSFNPFRDESLPGPELNAAIGDRMAEIEPAVNNTGIILRLNFPEIVEAPAAHNFKPELNATATSQEQVAYRVPATPASRTSEVQRVAKGTVTAATLEEDRENQRLADIRREIDEITKGNYVA